MRATRIVLVAIVFPVLSLFDAAGVRAQSSGLPSDSSPVDRRPNKAKEEIGPNGPSRDLPSCGDGTCKERFENYSTCPADCNTLDQRTDYFRGQLVRNGYGVRDGVFTIFRPENCLDFAYCFYNNPTSPYGIPQVPLGFGEPNPDPLNLRGNPPDLRRFFLRYRMQPDEAIVWIGQTPPECPYFSFTAYVFSRHNPNGIGRPPYGDRATIFASLSDSENQVTLRTSAAPGESPFEKESVVMMTADRGTDEGLRTLLNRSGFPDGMINSLVIPRFFDDGVTPKARMGYEDEGDMFTMLMRIAHPDAPVEGTPIHNWLINPSARVFRIRPIVSTTLDPFPHPVLRVPGTGQSEPTDSLVALVNRVRDHYSDFRVDARLAIPFEAANGDHCMENLTPCNGDCRDTPYMGNAFRLGDAPEAIIVVGRNHEKSGKAAYVNITSTRSISATAFYSVVMRDLIGSADIYLPDHPDRDNLWQMKFARQCHGEPFCYEITEEQIPKDDILAVLVRAYLEPATGTSAKVFPVTESELALPRLLKLSVPRNQGEW